MSDPLIIRIQPDTVAELEKLAAYYNLPSPTAALMHGVTLLQTFQKFGEMNADAAVVEANGATQRVNIYPAAHAAR